jgi:hypothetical protein
LRTNNVEGYSNKEDMSMEKTYLEESDPFVRRWLEVIEDGSIEAILEFLATPQDCSRGSKGSRQGLPGKINPYCWGRIRKENRDPMPLGEGKPFGLSRGITHWAQWTNPVLLLSLNLEMLLRIEKPDPSQQKKIRWSGFDPEIELLALRQGKTVQAKLIRECNHRFWISGKLAPLASRLFLRPSLELQELHQKKALKSDLERVWESARYPNTR